MRLTISATRTSLFAIAIFRSCPRLWKRRAAQSGSIPNPQFNRFNLALFAAYAGDFPTAEQESRAVQELNGFTNDPTANWNLKETVSPDLGS